MVLAKCYLIRTHVWKYLSLAWYQTKNIPTAHAIWFQKLKHAGHNPALGLASMYIASRFIYRGLIALYAIFQQEFMYVYQTSPSEFDGTYSHEHL